MILDDELGDVPEKFQGVVLPVRYGLKAEEGESVEIQIPPVCRKCG